MTIAEAQRHMREAYAGGSVGQAVSGILWLLSAALATWIGPGPGILALVVGGMFIYPLTVLALRLVGRPPQRGLANPLNPLAMQVAFTIPLALPVIGAAALRNVNWFYPAFMVVVGAHYLPFVFLYGMWQYALLAALLVLGGVGFGFGQPHGFTPGGWLTGVVLVLFAVWLGAAHRRVATD
jgi:hypothetical protein